MAYSRLKFIFELYPWREKKQRVRPDDKRYRSIDRIRYFLERGILLQYAEKNDSTNAVLSDMQKLIDSPPMQLQKWADGLHSEPVYTIPDKGE